VPVGVAAAPATSRLQTSAATQPLATPLQFSAASQGLAWGRHTVVAGSTASSQAIELALQASATSQTPFCARQMAAAAAVASVYFGSKVHTPVAHLRAVHTAVSVLGRVVLCGSSASRQVAPSLSESAETEQVLAASPLHRAFSHVVGADPSGVHDAKLPLKPCTQVRARVVLKSVSATPAAAVQ
jgi:hypothetical protein